MAITTKQMRGRTKEAFTAGRVVKPALTVPMSMIAAWSGGITEPEYADRVIREGTVDLIAVGRAMEGP